MNLQGAEPELSALCNDDEIYERKFSIRSFESKSNKFWFCFSPSACLSTRIARKNFALGAPFGVYMVFSDFDVSVLNHIVKVKSNRGHQWRLKWD